MGKKSKFYPINTRYAPAIAQNTALQRESIYPTHGKDIFN